MARGFSLNKSPSLPFLSGWMGIEMMNENPNYYYESENIILRQDDVDHGGGHVTFIY